MLSKPFYPDPCSSRLATRPRHVCAAGAHTRRPRAVSAVDVQAACAAIAASAVSTTSPLDMAVNGSMLQTKLMVPSLAETVTTLATTIPCVRSLLGLRHRRAVGVRGAAEDLLPRTCC